MQSCTGAEKGVKRSKGESSEARRKGDKQTAEGSGRASYLIWPWGLAFRMDTGQGAVSVQTAAPHSSVVP